MKEAINQISCAYTMLFFGYRVLEQRCYFTHIIPEQKSHKNVVFLQIDSRVY